MRAKDYHEPRHVRLRLEESRQSERMAAVDGECTLTNIGGGPTAVSVRGLRRYVIDAGSAYVIVQL